MSTADHVLDQIDNALHDYSVSDDAMRSRPEPEPEPLRFGGFIPTVEIRDEAGGWQELGHVTSIEIQVEPEFQQQWQELRDYLARVEAERVRRAQEALAAFARAYAQAIKPAMEAAAKGFAELQKAVQHIDPPLPPGRRRDRPAWQSPYGPPQRRR